MNTMFTTAFNKISATSSWFDKLRQENFAEFVRLGMPTRHEENWKYTDISSIAKNDFVMPERTNISAPLASPYLPKSHRIVFINGFFSQELSHLENLPKGSILTSLTSAMEKHSDLLKPYLANLKKNSLDCLNLALLTDGLFLWVPKNVEIAEPIFIRYINSSQQDILRHLRHVVLLETNATVSIIEESTSASANSQFINNYIHAKLTTGAQLTYYKYQNENSNSYCFADLQVEQGPNSSFKAYYFTKGGKIARENVSVSLMGSGASCKLYGYYQVNSAQHCDQQTRVDHLVPHTSSYELYKGIMEARSVGVFNGKVIVHPQAQNTRAQLINQNLLMAKNAEINTKPELEIYADNVQCNHGATVGRIDEKALFYLQARGITEDVAINIIKEAFLLEIIEQIPNADIKAWITTRLK